MSTDFLKAPFPYFGGKSRVARRVWLRFGADIPNYVEPFFGSGAVLLARPGKPRIETVNDLDGLLSNLWRALQKDPEAVAFYADWPVSEVDLHARHIALRAARDNVEKMIQDPEWYDAKLAGWWVWGISIWIGGEWCKVDERTRPHLSDAVMGINRQVPRLSGSMGVHRRIPHLGDAGKGVNKLAMIQLPHLGNAGRGIHKGKFATDRSQGILEYFAVLSARLRDVRIVCGDWSRVTGPSVTVKNGTTAVFLDPPYSKAVRDGRIYGREAPDIADDVRQWAIENGDNPDMRIALCGYDNEHGDYMPASWEALHWKAQGGYGNQSNGRGRDNASREVIWFSPHCLKSEQLSLF